MRFEFATAARIIFGEGTLREIHSLAPKLGSRPLIITGQTEERYRPLLAILSEAGLDVLTFAVSGEPTVEIVREGAEYAREHGRDFVLGIGGGSVIDAGKAISALITNRGETLDYLEVIGRGQPLTEAPVPYIAIPTTAGTGAEVTRNAVLGSPAHQVKVSMRSLHLLPGVALVDPELTYSMPPDITASTGMDALTQVIEPFVSKQANPLTDAICREGMRRAAKSLIQAYQDGEDRAARRDMSLASLFGGLALANARLGAVHGFAGPLGGMVEAAHGAICGRLLPPVMQVNLSALKARRANEAALGRYQEIAQILTGDPEAQPEDGLDWLWSLDRTLNLPPLADYGLQRADFPRLIEMASKSSSMQGNPVELTEDEMQEILERAF